MESASWFITFSSIPWRCFYLILENPHKNFPEILWNGNNSCRGLFPPASPPVESISSLHVPHTYRAPSWGWGGQKLGRRKTFSRSKTNPQDRKLGRKRTLMFTREGQSANKKRNPDRWTNRKVSQASIKSKAGVSSPPPGFFPLKLMVSWWED